MSEENKNQENSVNNSDDSVNQKNVAGGNTSNPSGSGENNLNNTVSYESHQKLLDEKKKVESKLKKFEADIEKAKQKELEEQGKIKELLEMERNTNNQLKESLKKNELKLLASEFHDPADILAYSDKFEFDDENNVTNSSTVLNELKEKKPYLFKGASEQKIGTETRTPQGFNKGHSFTEQEILNMDAETLQKNRAEILKQYG